MFVTDITPDIILAHDSPAGDGGGVEERLRFGKQKIILTSNVRSSPEKPRSIGEYSGVLV